MLKNIQPKEIKTNPFEDIGARWMLITAGDGDGANTMTASWGGMGIMWNKPVATCYIRPQRYTREFADSCDYFSLCFFDEDKRSVLAMCGSVSGRDCDKIKDSGLTLMSDKAAPYFAEAQMVLICRKLYRQPMSAEYALSGDVTVNYPDNDYHIMYMGEIAECLVNE